MASIVHLLNKKSGIMYAYTNERVYDETAKRYVNRRRCIGHVDPKTGKIIPNRSKKESRTFTVRSSGLNLLFSKISSDIGLTHALQTAFSKQWKMILTCAIYCTCDKKPLTNIGVWTSENENPAEKQLTQLDLNNMMVSIDSGSIDAFLRIWGRKIGDSQGLIFSFGCIDSYLRRPEESKFGLRLGHDSFVSDYEICFGRNSRMPIGYRYHTVPPANYDDIFTGYTRFPWSETDDFIYLLNPEMFTDNDLDELIGSRENFIAEIPNSHRHSMDAIRDYLGRRAGGDGSIINTGKGFYFRRGLEIDGRTVQQHLYYDIEQGEAESASFIGLIDKCRRELEGEHIVTSHAPIYETYYLLVQEEDGSVHIDLNSQRIMDATATAGFRTILTDVDIRPYEVFEWIRIRNDTSYLYDNMRNTADNSALKLYLATNSSSRDFIQFIALILMAGLRKRMKETGLSDRFSFYDVINAMSSLMTITVDGRKGPATSELTDDQRYISDTLDLM